MPLEVLFHPLAEADLNSLYDYIAADNPERALRQIYRIKERALGLAQMPMKGRARSDLMHVAQKCATVLRQRHA